MLDYENQIFLDILNEDGLVIVAKGLGIESVFLNLLKVYSDPGSLVLVLGTNSQEEHYYISRLEREGVFPLPKVITSESGSSAERMNVYLQGGVLFVSPRILVVDLLKSRLPIEHVTGILVYRAQSIVRSCQEAFAVRLFRQKNKTGFVKAFSSSAQAFTVGFAQVSRIMRMLFLKQLFLWPRFQAIVQSSLSAIQPKVIEMHVELTPAMTRIQNAILDLMSFTVKELKRKNPSMDFDELTVENAIAKSFHKILQLQLDPIWHQLSSRTKVLVADLKIFRVFLNYLVRYDSVTFNSFVDSFRCQSYAVSSSGWLLLDAANVLFTVARQRVAGESQPRAKSKDKPPDGKKVKSKLLLNKVMDVDTKPEEAVKLVQTKKLSKLSLTQRVNARNQLGESARTNHQKVAFASLLEAPTPPTSNTIKTYIEESDSDDVDGELEEKGEEKSKDEDNQKTKTKDQLTDVKNVKRRLVLDNIVELDESEEAVTGARAKKLSKLSLSQRDNPSSQLGATARTGASQQKVVLERLFDAVTPSKSKSMKMDVKKSDSDDVDGESEEKNEEKCKDEDDQKTVNPEQSPKWLVLKQILTEIKETSKATNEEELVRDKVLILVQDKRTAKQLQDFLVLGAREMLLQLYEKSLRKKPLPQPGRSYSGPNARSPTKQFQKFESHMDDGLEVDLSTQMMSKHRQSEEIHSSPKKDAEEGSGEDAAKSPAKEEEYKDVYVLSQCPKSSCRSNEKSEESEEAYEVIANQTAHLDESVGMETLDVVYQSPLLIIQTFKINGDPLSLPQTLEEMKPRFIVLYDVEVSAIRRIEVYQSLNSRVQVHVYFIVFGGSVEEQAYLTALRREKESFDHIIREKATMVVPADQDGKSDLCEALSRDVSKPNETVNTRRGGQDEPLNVKKQSTIIVDMREFNSELPAMIHRRGIEIEPVTLQVGDYILSPEICVERKSVSDLIGSLNHGRLYNQAKAMTRYYASPILLIEFDENKPLTLQGNYYISNDMSSNDVSSRLILLTLHFPQLKIVWSPSPFATAQLFEELKQVREEPDPIRAAEVGADLEQDLDVAERYNPAIHDLVARLPGVTTKNIHTLLRGGTSLDQLAMLSKADLTKLLQNGQEADSLFEAFHEKFKPGDATEKLSRRGGGGRWRGRGGFAKSGVKHTK